MADDPIVKEAWHLSKAIPVSIIFVVLLQFVGGVVIVGRMEERLTFLEDRALVTDNTITKLVERDENAASRLSAIEAILTRIEQHLQNLDDRAFQRDFYQRNNQRSVPAPQSVPGPSPGYFGGT